MGEEPRQPGAGALCPERGDLRRLSNGGSLGDADTSVAGAADAVAANALFAPDLCVFGALGRVPDRQISIEGERVALGHVSGGGVRRNVCFATSIVCQQPT